MKSLQVIKSSKDVPMTVKKGQILIAVADPNASEDIRLILPEQEEAVDRAIRESETKLTKVREELSQLQEKVGHEAVPEVLYEAGDDIPDDKQVGDVKEPAIEATGMYGEIDRLTKDLEAERNNIQPTKDALEEAQTNITKLETEKGIIENAYGKWITLSTPYFMNGAEDGTWKYYSSFVDAHELQFLDIPGAILYMSLNKPLGEGRTLAVYLDNDIVSDFLNKKYDDDALITCLTNQEGDYTPIGLCLGKGIWINTQHLFTKDIENIPFTHKNTTFYHALKHTLVSGDSESALKDFCKTINETLATSMFVSINDKAFVTNSIKPYVISAENADICSLIIRNIFLSHNLFSAQHQSDIYDDAMNIEYDYAQIDDELRRTLIIPEMIPSLPDMCYILNVLQGNDLLNKIQEESDTQGVIYATLSTVAPNEVIYVGYVDGNLYIGHGASSITDSIYVEHAVYEDAEAKQLTRSCLPIIKFGEWDTEIFNVV